MDFIDRKIGSLDRLLKKNKVIVLYGPRRVGKTTLINKFLEKTEIKHKFYTGDDIGVRNILTSENVEKIKNFASNTELLVIDEAQKIPKVGEGLKIVVDHVENIKVLITGSASLSLSYKIGEPLLGRKFDYILYPIWQGELLGNLNKFELEQKIGDYLVYGSYPEILTSESSIEKENVLKEIINSYLFKDILELEKVKGSQVLLNLLRLIAYQVGSEVSLTELSNKLDINLRTVERYLKLFEQSFILFRVGGYSRNLREEVTSKSKYYFYDNGIRNAVINNFNDLEIRNDVGSLWENFLVIERLKKLSYSNIHSNFYFWRTWNQAEVDWVEEGKGELSGFEFKWGKQRSSKSKENWLGTYKDEATYKVISKENYFDFIL